MKEKYILILLLSTYIQLFSIFNTILFPTICNLRGYEMIHGVSSVAGLNHNFLRSFTIFSTRICVSKTRAVDCLQDSRFNVKKRLEFFFFFFGGGGGLIFGPGIFFKVLWEALGIFFEVFIFAPIKFDHPRHPPSTPGSQDLTQGWSYLNRFKLPTPITSEVRFSD